MFKKRQIERRGCERKNRYCLIKYRPFGEKGDYAETIASIRNISGSGVLFKSKSFVPLDCKLEMKINIPTTGAVLDVAASVVRFEKSKSGMGYRFGAKFLGIEEGQRKKIIEFIKPRQ